MSFIESRLLDTLTVGVQGGPTWSTRKVALKSGIVRRNPMRSRPLYRFTIPNHPLDPTQSAIIIAAFNACRGGCDGFRFKDWGDWVAANELLPVVGTGAPQSVQLVKTYAFGANSVTRQIRKPVAGSVVISANGTPISSTLDSTTGIATFTAASAAVLRWSGQFDVPVVFSADELVLDTVGRNGKGLVLSVDVDLEEDLAQ